MFEERTKVGVLFFSLLRITTGNLSVGWITAEQLTVGWKVGSRHDLVVEVHVPEVSSLLLSGG